MIRFKSVKFKNNAGKIQNRKYWTDDGLSWYWVGARIPASNK